MDIGHSRCESGMQPHENREWIRSQKQVHKQGLYNLMFVELKVFTGIENDAK